MKDDYYDSQSKNVVGIVIPFRAFNTGVLLTLANLVAIIYSYQITKSANSRYFFAVFTLISISY